jgi:hypothetical protein
MTRRMLITAAVALLVVPGFAQAQSQVTATATVANFSQLTGSGDLQFGTLSRVTDTTIDAAGGAGHASRTLSYNHNVRVTFSNVPAALSNGGGLNLPVALTCAGRVGTGTWSTPAACSSAALDLDVGAALTQATLGFGGTITAANVASAVAGTYAGTLDIVVVAR